MRKKIFAAAAFFLTSSLIFVLLGEDPVGAGQGGLQGPLSEDLQGPLGEDLQGPLSEDLQGPTLDNVLARYYQAQGGLDKLLALKSWKMSGRIAISLQGQGLPMELWQKGPNQMRVETTFQNQKIIQAFDGQKAWWIMPFISKEAREMPPEQDRLFREQAEFANPLVVFKEKGYKLELAGKEDMEGKPVFKLVLTRTDGRKIFFFLDAESGIELKSSQTLKAGESDSLVEIVYGDYKPVDGLLLPHVVENRMNGVTRVRLTMDSIDVNPVLEDDLFASPDKKEAPKADAQKK